MKKSNNVCDLSSCLFCRLCLKEWLPALEHNRSTIKVKKGDLIFNEGDTMTGVYFVYSGILKVHKKWGSDKELIVRFAGKGDIVGHRGLGEDNVYPVSATALENSSVCFINLDFFLSSLKVNHDFLYKLMMFFAEELKVSERKMRNLAHMPVKGRVAQAIINLHKKFGIDEEGFIRIVLSRQDLASFAGTTYETVFRILSEFTSDAVIARKGKAISVLDFAKLKSYTTDEV